MLILCSSGYYFLLPLFFFFLQLMVVFQMEDERGDRSREKNPRRFIWR